jgi:CDP-diacylglycerol--glycerol-3-phosphate 3-phosphatidyltransferase
MVPFFILFIEMGGFWPAAASLLIFVAASVTDLLDGIIARKNNMVTSLGIFLDPLADKLLISAAFICFIDISYLNVPAWMVIAIISREFLITGLRTIAAAKNVIIPADKSGKFKTTSQIVVIIAILLIIITNEMFVKFYGVTPEMLTAYDKGSYRILALIMQKTPFWAVLAATALTVYSGFNYMWKHRGLFK